jgi:hypothetical protein
LADYVGAPLEDVVKYSLRGELRKFLARTDIDGGKPLLGQSAKVAVLAKRWPVAEQPPLSGAVAVVRTLAKKHPRPWPPL